MEGADGKCNEILGHLGGCHLSTLNAQDQQLILQWCTSTYRSISWDKSVERIWRVVIPGEASHHPSLMSGLLALSALHLAHLSSGTDRKDYLDIAKSHRALALADPPICTDGSSCNAVFARSTILSIFSFALPRITKPATTAVDNLLQIFQLVRSSINALDIVDQVQRGHLGSLVQSEKSTPNMPDTSQLAIVSLRKLNATLSRDPRHEKDIYEVTIRHLSLSFEMFMNESDAAIVAFLWICRIPPRFMSLVEERQPFALVILAHFTVILHSLRRQWWMGEWSTRILDEIGQNLGSEWRQSISWVMDAVGWYIPA